MFQPEVKFEFVRRYCPPAAGWQVFVDIDASEEGRTGGPRTSDEARQQQEAMLRDAQRVRAAFATLGVVVGGERRAWFEMHRLPVVNGDRDIVAMHPEERRLVIAEVEGASTGQPEQKLYKAIGQLVMAAGEAPPEHWQRSLVLVVHGAALAKHLNRAAALATLGVAGLELATEPGEDRWCFSSNSGRAGAGRGA